MATSTFVSRGRRGTWRHSSSFCVAGVALGGTYGTGLALVAGLVAGDAAALCVAGVALGDFHLRSTWQAWHLETFTFVLRGRRGTYGTGSPVTPRHFAWQAWRNVISTFVSRGRRGAMSHPPSFCVAGVALMALGVALGLVLVARDVAALCMAGVALGDLHLRFTWQAWRNVTSTFVLRGRRGTYGTGRRAWAGFLSPVTRRHFAWQAWHNVISTFVSRGRPGVLSHPPSFCVAGVALMARGGALGLVLVARNVLV